MSSIQTGIELQDGFTPVLFNIMSSINLAIDSLYDMQQSMNADIDTSSLEGARESINQATMAIEELNAAIEDRETMSVSTPPVSSVSSNSSKTPEPIQWQNDSIDVFTSTGIDRFQQEVQSTNNMLEQLSSKQNAIASQAFNTHILPAEAFLNLNSLAVRIDMVRDRIGQIENNAVNFGTNTANTELEHLRGQLRQALTEQNNLNNAMQDMDASAANAAYLKLSQAVGNTEQYIRDNVDEQGRFNQQITEGTNKTNSFTGAIKSITDAYMNVETIGKILNLSDGLTQTTSKLNLMNDGVHSTSELVNMVYASAQNARGSFLEMAGVVARFGTNAKNAFGSSAEVVEFAGLVQKQMTIAGASTEETSNAMLQLSQALGSGVISGDELNSIFEQAPNIIQNIADYLQMPIEEIGKIGSNGEFSANVVKQAIFSASDDINAKFNEMPMTWSQIWQSMQNTALIAFQPVLQKINDLGNSNSFQTFTRGIIECLAVVASITTDIFDLVGNVGSYTSDNWSLIAPIVYGVVGALAAYNAVLITYNTIQAIANGLKQVATFREAIHSAAVLMSTGKTFAATAAQHGLNAALLACPLTWIIILIIALIVIIYAVVAAVNKFAGTSISATGIIAGSFLWVMALIGNIVIGTLNAIIQYMWRKFVEPIISIVEWILNVFSGGFDSLGDAVANLLGQIISWFLSFGKVATKIIDAIFGTNWTSGLSSLQDSVLEWGKNDSAITINRRAPEIDYRFDMTDAFDTGNKFGEGIDKTIANFSVSDLLNTNELPTSDEYPFDGIVSNVEEIENNTKGSLDITEEQLKYMRDLAEQETVNRYTIAEVHIEQTNHNKVSSGMDLDGVISGLTNAVDEAVEIVTEGVHE